MFNPTHDCISGPSASNSTGDLPFRLSEQAWSAGDRASSKGSCGSTRATLLSPDVGDGFSHRVIVLPLNYKEPAIGQSPCIESSVAVALAEGWELIAKRATEDGISETLLFRRPATCSGNRRFAWDRVTVVEGDSK